MRTIPVWFVGMLVCGVTVTAQVRLGVGGTPRFRGIVDRPPSTYVSFGDSQLIVAGILPDGSSARVRFALTGVTLFTIGDPRPIPRGYPLFVSVSPSSGTTPATLSVGLNHAQIRGVGPGNYALNLVFSTLDQDPPSTATVTASLMVVQSLSPKIESVSNAASRRAAIAPGSLVTIRGINLCRETGNTQYSVGGVYPLEIEDPTSFGPSTTSVTFNGVAASILYAAPDRMDVVVPYELAGQSTAEVVVSRYRLESPVFSVPVQDTAPAIYTVSETGTGQGSILNVPFADQGGGPTPNSPENPAAPGSVITFFVTGAGGWDDPSVASGAVYFRARRFTAKPVSLTVGGKAAQVDYVGVAPYEVWGKLQVNAHIPRDAPPGEQPIVLKIGERDNTEQNVTVSVR